MNRAFFLDRDGVLNNTYIREGKAYAPHTLAEMEILPGVAEALKVLHQAGFLLIVVTNQPDVARGTMRREDVEEINKYMMEHLPIDEFYTCFHDNADHCDCRKPKSGSFLAAAKKYDIDLGKSYMIGDRWSDVEAGRRAGCKTFFIDYGYAEKQPESVDYRVDSLLQASQIILR